MSTALTLVSPRLEFIKIYKFFQNYPNLLLHTVLFQQERERSRKREKERGQLQERSNREWEGSGESWVRVGMGER